MAKERKKYDRRAKALPRANALIGKEVANVEIFDLDTVKVFLVHRRVMTDLYKWFDLRGYEIDCLLAVGRECRYDIDTVVTGATLRAKASRRYNNVLGAIIDKLVSRGFLEHAEYAGQMNHYRLRITSQGLIFLESYRKSLNNHLSNDNAELILNARFSWEKALKKDKE